MNLNLSYKNILQWAFALSPIPSYLPQYFSIMQQLASADDNADTTNGNGPSTFDNAIGSDVNISDDGANTNNGTAATTTTTSRMVERGGGDHYYLRKRNLPDSSSSSSSAQNISSVFSTTSPTSDGAPSTIGLNMLPGTPSKSFDQAPMNGNSNIEENNSTDNTNKQLDAGLSVATVLLLLSSHLLRLLYFHGLILEEERPVLPIASAADELIITPTTANGQPARNRPSALQWDLLGQSLSMIVVQLMLLHAMMLLRRKQIQRQRKNHRLRTIVSSNGDIAVSGHYHSSTESLVTASAAAGLPPGSDHNNSFNDANDHNNNNVNGNASSSYWQKKSRQLSRDTTAHLHNLFSPRNILQKHSFLEYLELLFLSSMAVKLVFDFHWYPMYRMRVVEGLKHTSICMESCLALPQMMRNYRNRTTEGLSVVMVGGWVAGDFFKLCYFLFSMIGSSSVDDTAEGGPNNSMFALGSLLSLSLDSVVGVQMAWWYPEPWALQWQQRIMRSVRHWKTNKDDDAGESLLVNNEQMMRGGLFAWIVRMFFRGVRGIRPPSNNTS